MKLICLSTSLWCAQHWEPGAKGTETCMFVFYVGSSSCLLHHADRALFTPCTLKSALSIEIQRPVEENCTMEINMNSYSNLFSSQLSPNAGWHCAFLGFLKGLLHATLCELHWVSHCSAGDFSLPHCKSSSCSRIRQKPTSPVTQSYVRDSCQMYRAKMANRKCKKVSGAILLFIDF